MFFFSFLFFWCVVTAPDDTNKRQSLNRTVNEFSVISFKMKYSHITPRRIKFYFTGACFHSFMNNLGQLPFNLFQVITFTLGCRPSKSSGVS
ncbi:hypothetical protein J3E69DRAFT_351624 [Trichoderma sp. SZMC 28015]